MTTTSSLTLVSPIVVEHDWQHIWFDYCHQHALLLNKAYFYTLSFESKNPTPNMYYHQEDLPKNIILAKLSLDLKIIAIQSTLLSVLVIDTTCKKKWLIDVKYPNDNAILTDGIIWSDHGGNSQDLVIVTTRGLELYKISQIRNQCKLSRVISQPGSFTFWYEPTHRMTLMASCQKSHSSVANTNYYGDRNGAQNNNHRPAHMNEILLMDGYFLNHERSLLPVLELPAPDKAPRFELGPGVLSDNISLHSLYGRLCCLVHYTESDSSDFITVYHVTKYSVTRAHCLSLNCITDTLKFSVYDNLLLCHSQHLHTTFLFDLLKSPKRVGPNRAESRETTDPVCEHPTRIHFMEFVAGTFEPSSSISTDAAATGHSTSTTSSATILKGVLVKDEEDQPDASSSPARGDLHGDSDDDSEGGEGSGGDRDSEQALGDEHSVDSLDAEDNDESEWNAISDSKHKLSLLATMGFPRVLDEGGSTVTSSGRQQIDVSIKDFANLRFQGVVSAYVTTHSTNSNNAALPSVVLTSQLNSHTTRGAGAGGGGAKGRVVSIKHAPPAVDTTSTANRMKLLAQPLYLAEVYYSDLYEFRYPNLLFDKGKKIMYRLVVDCAAVLTEGVQKSSKESFHFLARRGQLYMQFNRPAASLNGGGNAQLAAIMQSYSNPTNQAERALNYKYISEMGRIAKYLLLKELFTCVESSRECGLSSLVDLVSVLMTPYTNEHRRQQRVLNETESVLESGGGGYAISAASNGGSTNYSVSSKETTFGMLRRKTLSDGIFGGLKQQQTGRKGSIAGLTLGGGGAGTSSPGGSGGVSEADNSCFFLDSEPLEPDSSSSSSSTYLPDISRIGIRARGLIEQQQSASSVSIAAESLSFVPESLTTRRDVFGNLIVTQSEILSYVWLPLMLSIGSNEQFDDATWALQSYVSALREMEIPLLPANSLLLMNVMFCRGRYMEVARLLQMNFFPDAGEVAMSALELRDILEDLLNYHERKHDESAASSPTTNLKIFSNVNVSGNALDQQRTRCAIATLQQSAIDMLWRLDEKSTIVRWHLTHGLVAEAIMLCTKKLGVWRSGLPPGCISGSEFFSSAIKVVSSMTVDQGASSDLRMAHRLITESEAMDRMAEQEYRAERQSRNLAEGKDEEDGLDIIRILEIPFDPVSPISVYPFRDMLVQEQIEALNSRRVALLYTVYQFVREWDNSVLLVSTNLIKSKLAVQTQFPEHLFDAATSRKFKELFGFL